MDECNHMSLQRAKVKPALFKCSSCDAQFTTTEIFTRLSEEKLQPRAVLMDDEVFNIRLMPQTGPDVIFGGK